MNNNSYEKIQQQIYECIEKHPGLHLSKISELLNMRISDVEIHLQFLVQKGSITSKIERGFKRYYLKDDKIDSRKKRIQETRKQIYSIISQNPGIHHSKIAELQSMSIQLVDYHLMQMERKKSIVGIPDSHGYYTRYYIADSSIDSQDKKTLEVLRKKTPLEIVLLLIKHRSLQHKDIARYLKMSTSRISYHLNKLVSHDLVIVTPHGSDKGYALNNRKDAIRLVKKYNLQLELDIAIDDFVDIWKDLHYEE